VVLSKFVNRMMWEGKRSTSLKIVHDAMGILQQKADKDPLEVFLKAIDNVKPIVEVKSRREALGMRWIINAARARSGRAMEDRLAAELLDAFNSTGTAFKKKEDTHKMAEANKAFAHYRW
jgi:small subunit ribosomal protein S7